MVLSCLYVKYMRHNCNCNKLQLRFRYGLVNFYEANAANEMTIIGLIYKLGQIP